MVVSKLSGARSFVFIFPTLTLGPVFQKHASVYPAHARMALNILPVAAATVGVESLFSRSKELLTDRRSRLSPIVVDQIQCLEHNWKRKIVDLVRANERMQEELYMQDFEYLEVQQPRLAEVDDSDSDGDE